MDNLQAIAELVRPHIHRGTFFLPERQTTDWYVNGRAFMLTPEASILAAASSGICSPMMSAALADRLRRPFPW
jgi:hypothetical protein